MQTQLMGAHLNVEKYDAICSIAVMSNLPCGFLTNSVLRTIFSSSFFFLDIVKDPAKGNAS